MGTCLKSSCFGSIRGVGGTGGASEGGRFRLEGHLRVRDGDTGVLDIGGDGSVGLRRVAIIGCETEVDTAKLQGYLSGIMASSPVRMALCQRLIIRKK